jgi:hypothetical protein
MSRIASSLLKRSSKDPKHTVIYDDSAGRGRSSERVAEIGADGKLVVGANARNLPGQSASRSCSSRC